MTRECLKGMEARANGYACRPHRGAEWKKGWKCMDDHIRFTLTNATNMLEEIERIKYLTPDLLQVTSRYRNYAAI
jgi:hypothetical protein